MIPSLFQGFMGVAGGPIGGLHALLDKLTTKKGDLTGMEHWQALAYMSALTGKYGPEVADLVGQILGQEPLTVGKEEDYDYIGREYSQKAYDRREFRRQKRFDLLARIAEEKKREAAKKALEEKMKRVREEARK